MKEDTLTPYWVIACLSYSRAIFWSEDWKDKNKKEERQIWESAEDK